MADLTPEEHEYIKNHYTHVPYKIMARYLKISYESLVRKINIYLEEEKKNRTVLNKDLSSNYNLHVDWSDITEEEMIRRYITPTYSELSGSEKKIFNKINNLKNQ